MGWRVGESKILQRWYCRIVLIFPFPVSIDGFRCSFASWGGGRKGFSVEDFCNCMFVKSFGLTGTRLTFSSSSKYFQKLTVLIWKEYFFSRVAGALCLSLVWFPWYTNKCASCGCTMCDRLQRRTWFLDRRCSRPLVVFQIELQKKDFVILNLVCAVSSLVY